MHTTNSTEAPAASRKFAGGPFHINGTRFLLLLLFFSAWHLLTARGILPKFFFGEPARIFEVLGQWVSTGSILEHLAVTLAETILSFAIGAVAGLGFGLWLALTPFWAAVLDPFIKAANSMPRIIFAPIFAVWFGLGIWSKVALGVTLVFFLVFFNVYQGVREVSPTILDNARMLGARQSDLLRRVYLPSAMTWLFSSLHNSVGTAFVGAVVGEYLGASRGIGYLILQAESVFDINTVFAGIIVLTVFAGLLDALISMIERRLLRWQPDAR